MAILSQLQSKPEPGIGTAVFLLRNLTIDPAVWPAGGYTISTPLMLVGQTTTGTLTWVDFQRVPRFLTTIGEGGYGMYVYFQVRAVRQGARPAWRCVQHGRHKHTSRALPHTPQHAVGHPNPHSCTMT